MFIFKFLVGFNCRFFYTQILWVNTVDYL